MKKIKIGEREGIFFQSYLHFSLCFLLPLFFLPGGEGNKNTERGGYEPDSNLKLLEANPGWFNCLGPGLCTPHTAQLPAASPQVIGAAPPKSLFSSSKPSKPAQHYGFCLLGEADEFRAIPALCNWKCYAKNKICQQFPLPA